jgi:ABC-type glycerol-3-phosphate transport system substrate-binding protein
MIFDAFHKHSDYGAAKAMKWMRLRTAVTLLAALSLLACGNDPSPTLKNNSTSAYPVESSAQSGAKTEGQLSAKIQTFIGMLDQGNKDAISTLKKLERN